MVDLIFILSQSICCETSFQPFKDIPKVWWTFASQSLYRCTRQSNKHHLNIFKEQCKDCIFQVIISAKKCHKHGKTEACSVSRFPVRHYCDYRLPVFGSALFRKRFFRNMSQVSQTVSKPMGKQCIFCPIQEVK